SRLCRRPEGGVGATERALPLVRLPHDQRPRDEPDPGVVRTARKCGLWCGRVGQSASGQTGQGDVHEITGACTPAVGRLDLGGIQERARQYLPLRVGQPEQQSSWTRRWWHDQLRRRREPERVNAYGL